MKRWLILGVVLAVLIFAALNVKIMEPADFTGAWYSAGDGSLYIFQDGWIECPDYEIMLLNQRVFSGAYSFSRNQAAVFLVDEQGVSEVLQLYLVHRKDGDVLCETKDGTGTILFFRNQKEAVMYRNTQK